MAAKEVGMAAKMERQTRESEIDVRWMSAALRAKGREEAASAIAEALNLSRSDLLAMADAGWSKRMVWTDENPEHDRHRRITDGIAAFEIRFGCAPNSARINAKESVKVAGLKVVASPTIPTNHIIFSLE